MSAISHELSTKLDEIDALLQLELDEQRARADTKLSAADKILEAKGLLLRKAVVDDESPALLGRTRLVLVDDPSRPGQIDRFGVRAGAVVEIREVDDDGKHVAGPRGIVARARRGRIEVVFDGAGAVSLDKGIDLIRRDDEQTLRRLREGLHAIRDLQGRRLRLVETLLGLRSPQPPSKGNLTAFDDALHDDQLRAVQLAVFCEEVALVHGPPGTGKTRVLVEVVRQLVSRGNRVLCLAASNAGVDNLAAALLDADAGLALARTGHPARVHPRLEAHSLAALTERHERRQLARNLVEEAFETLRNARRRSDRGRQGWRREREARVEAGRLFADARRLERQAVDEVLRKTRILCGTLTGFQNELAKDETFDVLVVDEASQALTPALLLGLPRVDRIVLAGDHRQLPPTVLSQQAADAGLEKTAFEMLRTVDDERVEGAFSQLLRVQHRMHEDIMSFPSGRFYDGHLIADDGVRSHLLTDLDVNAEPNLSAAAVDVIDTAGASFDEETLDEDSSRRNPEEATLIEALVRATVEAGLPADAIGVVTPYSAQVALIAGKLADLIDKGLEVDSADGFQGREKEAIFVSSVRSNADAEVGFLSDQRRLNVALTRARRKLVVVGDSATLGSDADWRSFFDTAIENGWYRSVFELPEDVAPTL